MSPLTITIKAWSAWAPGVQTPEDWEQWAQGQKTIGGETPPDVKTIPAMLRRRLSPLGKMALATAMPLLENVTSGVPSVLVSRHGDLNRTVKLLTDLADREDLSPTHFSLSVHNAIGGLLSITRKDTSSMTALACGFDDISTALLEAQAILTEQDCEQVLCLIYDEPVPEVYRQQQAITPSYPYATAFLLGTPVEPRATSKPGESTPNHGITVELELCRADTSAPAADADAPQPQALSLLRWLLSGSRPSSLTSSSLTPPPLTLAGARNCWRWSLC